MIKQGVDNLKSCDFAKNILIILVVLYHSMAFFGGNWFTVLGPVVHNRILGTLASWLGTFHVQSFTLISGYIYCYLKNERGRYNDIHAFIVNKAKRLIIPYIAISLLWVVPLSNIFYKYSFADILTKYALGQAPAQLWFLLMLFNVFILAYIILDKNGHRWWLVLLLFAGGIILPMHLPNVFQVFTAMRFLLFFYVGYLIRQYSSKTCVKHIGRAGVQCLAMNIILFIIIKALKFDGTVFNIIELVLSNVCQVFGSMAAFFLLSYLANHISWENRFFESLSKVNFTVYLVHQQIIYIFLWYFAKAYNPYIVSMICFIASLSISWIIGIVMNKWKLSQALVGAK